MLPIGPLFRFYARAVTRYQLHSPFVYALADAVLQDNRYYYAFDAVEALRQKMLDSDVVVEVFDYGTGGATQREYTSPLRALVRKAASSPRQGRWLFRLANHLKPATILELGTSTGIGLSYLASAARKARIVSLEGSPVIAEIARTNLSLLGLNADIVTGPFETTLAPALHNLGKADMVVIDGNHTREATLQYFNTCLPYLQENSVVVLDDIYHNTGMQQAWQAIRQHPAVTFTVDCYDLSLVFFQSEMKVKQHFSIVPSGWKPWKVF